MTLMGAVAATAWNARDNAHLHGPTAVGAVVVSEQGRLYAGCNIEHRFRAHDVHAEVNALSSMVASGDGPAIAVLIVAERDSFTPCGSCMDWIFELGSPTTIVGFANRDNVLTTYRADELMPHYPH